MSLNETASGERLHIGFFGMRNAGKSSVVNQVTGQELSVVSDVLGTTTDPVTKAMELLPLGPVMIIDTPGMRELGMWDVTEGLGDAFSDVEEIARGCRFRDCRHENEPGCAVREAIENGTLDASRFESYKKIKAEAKYSVGSADYRRQKEQFFRNIAIGERKKHKDVY